MPTPDPNPIVLNINGRVVQADPAPILRDGSVLVPLRGVLENLNARVNYNPTSRGITIEQGGKRVLLVLDSTDALVGTTSVKLTAAPQIIGSSTYVPLRSLAELFGFSVQWLAAVRTVSVGNSGAVAPSANHRAVLEKAGPLGVNISLVEGEGPVSDADADRLLDAAKAAGASLVKIRFDWGVLEPTSGGAFQWPFYDRVVAEARERGLVVVGVLGQSAKWASTFYKSTDPELWRNGAPRESQMKAWQNYVGRVVGRYKNDVHAWQVWEKTSPERFRSSQTIYRRFLLPAAREARKADPSAIVFAAESGGLELNVIQADVSSLAAPFLNGIVVYPGSQTQPGVVNPSSTFLRPYASLRNDPLLRGSGPNSRDYWVGGLSRPVLRDGDVVGETATDDPELKARLLQTFTTEAQADYLAQSSALALAAGSAKVFWGELRDAPRYESVAPINPEYGSGLLRRDFTPRPAYLAFRTVAEQTRGKRFIGSLALGPDIIALVFDDGQSTSVVAWSIAGGAQLVVNQTGQNPGVPNSLYISSRPDTQILNSTGNLLATGQAVLPLTQSPLWISRVAYETRNAVQKPGERGLLLAAAGEPPVYDAGVSASFSAAGNESGLYWRRFLNYRGAANDFVNENGRSGLMTTTARDVLDPSSGKFFIFLDVDDDYLYFTRDVPVEVSVVVKRPPVESGSLITTTAGFNIEYSTPAGTGRTPWQVVEPGEGYATYTYTLPNATFSSNGSYDLTINTFGSKRNLVFSSVMVRRQ